MLVPGYIFTAALVVLVALAARLDRPVPDDDVPAPARPPWLDDLSTQSPVRVTAPLEPLPAYALDGPHRDGERP